MHVRSGHHDVPRRRRFDRTVAAARAALDAWVREVVAWHFDPATGCPFWLDYAQKARLGSARARSRASPISRGSAQFEDEWLRGGPVQRWIPKGLAGKPVFVFETGGTTGMPKTRVAFDDFRTDYELFSDDAARRVSSRRARTG